MTEVREQFLLVSVSRPDAILRLLLLYLLLVLSVEPYSRHWMREAKRRTSLCSVWKPLVLKMRISQVMDWYASPDAVLATVV
jgi:hypothetical protein